MSVGDSASFRLALLFRDPDGDPLAFSAYAVDPGVLSVHTGDSMLFVRAERAGETALIVTATDPSRGEDRISTTARVRWPPATGFWHGTSTQLAQPVSWTLHLEQVGPHNLIGRVSLWERGRLLSGWLGSGTIDHPRVHMSGWGADNEREIVFHIDALVDRAIGEMVGRVTVTSGISGQSALTLRRIVPPGSAAQRSRRRPGAAVAGQGHAQGAWMHLSAFQAHVPRSRSAGLGHRTTDRPDPTTGATADALGERWLRGYARGGSSRCGTLGPSPGARCRRLWVTPKVQ